MFQVMVVFTIQKATRWIHTEKRMLTQNPSFLREFVCREETRTQLKVHKISTRRCELEKKIAKAYTIGNKYQSICYYI